MKGSSTTWKPSNEMVARNLQLTMLSYTPKSYDDHFTCNALSISDDSIQKSKNGFINNNPSKQPDVACIVPATGNEKSLQDAAVVIRHGMKYYGSGNSISPVLKDFNMTVPKGTIYSLLGSSGCGKTTVLSCIVGLKSLNSGDVYVFGKRPGDKDCGVPGRMVGYMPQELALYESMSIREIIGFYGRLSNLTVGEIRSRTTFLVKLLDLPNATRRIESLSCGQKRRVSLALTLIHAPELLILDEPTVGVDPLLRESIWDHLMKLVSNHGTTVIITTHYVEEAHRSQTIGLMRNGRLLTEDNPKKLLVDHQAESLTDIVLKLCKNDAFEESPVRDDQMTAAISAVKDAGTFTKKDCSTDGYMFSGLSFARIKALTMKNSLLMLRNFWLILLILLNPAFDVCLVNIAMGGEPNDLPFGIVNQEVNFTHGGCPTDTFEYETCILANLSCRFLHGLKKYDTFDMVNYPNDDEAFQAVDEGKIWGFLSFPNGYSDSLFERATEGLNIDNTSLRLSNVHFRMDATNRPVAAVMVNTVFETYKLFIRGLLTDCGFNPEYSEVPVKVLEPTHGSISTDMKEFVAPGLLLGILFFYPYCSGTLAVIFEKKQGTLQRTQVAGASVLELMISFFFAQFVVLMIQSVSTFFLTTYYFGIEVQGSVALGLTLSILTGLDGVSMGFFVSSFCNGELEAVIIGIGYFLANFICSGTLWPIQAGPEFMQYFSYFFPATLPNEAVRSIISRGWGINHIRVWPAFVSEIGRIAVFWVLTIIIHKLTMRRK